MLVYASVIREVSTMSERSRKLGQIIMGLNRAQQGLTLLLNQELAPLGLNLNRLTILARFASQPNKSQSITALVQATGMNQPNVTKIVSHLIAQEWLVTQVDPQDARRKALRITPAGVALVIRAYGKATPAIDQAFEQLSDEQIQHLFSGLEQLNSK